MLLGAARAGMRGMKVMAGSASNFDFSDWDWCLTEADDFVQAIQVPGGVLVSPIEITAAPLPDKALQGKPLQC